MVTQEQQTVRDIANVVLDALMCEIASHRGDRENSDYQDGIDTALECVRRKQDDVEQN